MTISIKGGNSATTTGRILDRPYVGLWKPNFRKTLSYSPDALVYINGDTSLVGCKDCNNRIDFQPYITQVSCGAGVEASSGDANISFSIPKHHGDSIFKDGAFLITPGLEVNIYIRGVFDVKDLNHDEIIDYHDGDIYNLKDLKMKPYYPVFHGVVTSISYAYSGGFYNGSFSCNNLLYFWQYQHIDTNTAAEAARPSESPGSVQMQGHKYTGATPHQIIYSLFRDTGGSAQGVVAGINKKTNVNARVGKQDAFSLSLRYWERRFSQGMYGLRMHGSSGRLFSSLEQVYYGRIGAGASNRVISETLGGVSKQQPKDKATNPTEGLNFARARNIVKYNERGGRRIVERNLDIQQVQATGESGGGNTTADMQAYVLDMGNLAGINMWESTYETKQQIASTVAEKVNFEFYQDVDGDLVFKPPLYNLNTKSSRVYVLKPEDIVSMNFSVKEPQYTYAVVKGVLYKNLNGVNDDEFVTPKSTYIDYRLVAKYGWRPLEIDSNIHTNTTSAFYYAAAELDRQNQEAETASVTITLRPELKPGYPVYIEHIDCYYYVTSVSHDFSYGSSCSTTIEIKARRKRFMPPGDINVSYKDSPEKAVDLINTNKGAKYLKKKEKTVGTSGIEGEEIIKVVGFPNVVMGLDMTRIDPNFWYMGSETAEASKPHFKQMLIVEAISLGVLKIEGDKDPFDPQARFTVWDVSRGEDGQIGVTSSQDISQGQAQFESNTARYQQELDRIAGSKQSSEAKAEAREDVKNRLEDNFAGMSNVVLGNAPTDTQTPVGFQYDQERERALLNPVGGANTTVTLLDLINIMRITKQRANEISTGMGSTANILELLANKKNAFSPHIPGYFRYFSCSHPDPKMQGSTEIQYSVNGDGVLESVGEVLLKTSEERFNGNKINMIVPDPTSTDGDLVTFTEAYPTAGLKVKNPFTQKVDVIPTNEITSLTFQEHEIYVKASKSANKVVNQEIWAGLPPDLYKGNKNNIKNQFLNGFVKNGLKKNIKTANPDNNFTSLILDVNLITAGDSSVPDTIQALIQIPDQLYKENKVVAENTVSSVRPSVQAQAIAKAYEELAKGLAFEWIPQSKYAWMRANGTEENGAYKFNEGKEEDYNLYNAGNVYIDDNYFKKLFNGNEQNKIYVNKSWNELKEYYSRTPEDQAKDENQLNNQWCGSFPAFCYKDIVTGFSIQNFASTYKIKQISSTNKLDESKPLFQMEWLEGDNLSNEDIQAGDIVVIWNGKENSKANGSHITLCVEPPKGGTTFVTIEGNTGEGSFVGFLGRINNQTFSYGVKTVVRNVSKIRFVYRVREKFLIPPVQDVQTDTQNQTETNSVKLLLEYAAGNLWTAVEMAHKAYFDITKPVLEQTKDEFDKTKLEYSKLSDTLRALTDLIIPPINKPNEKITVKVPQGEYTKKTKKSMVFPVSDEEGYEVYGFQPYGRGLDLKSNSTYMSLVQQDFTRLLTAGEVESIYKLFKTTKDKDELRTGITKELESIAKDFAEMDPDRREIIYNTTGFTPPQDLDDREQIKEAFLTQFANRILSQEETDRYDKENNNRYVLAENIPRALNQIAPGGTKNSGSVCQCRGYDSDLDLENLDGYNTPFVKLDFSGAEEDKFSQKLHDVMIEKGVAWKEQQEIYRGSDTADEISRVGNQTTIKQAIDTIINNINTSDERVAFITDTYSDRIEAIEKSEKDALEQAALNKKSNNVFSGSGVLWTEKKGKE